MVTRASQSPAQPSASKLDRAGRRPARFFVNQLALARILEGMASGAACSPWAFALLAGCAALACEPKLVVGEWACPATDAGSDASTPLSTDPIATPWSTGFENGFCDFTAPVGFCLAGAGASYRLVESPVRTGRFAAAFSANTGDDAGHQTRCVRQGALPTAAYYGAWYYLPTPVTNPNRIWNLFHFQGGDPSGQHGLWDVSLVNTSDGHLQAVAYGFLDGITRSAATPVPIPIGIWFHLEFYLERAAVATGKVALYQDDQPLVDATGLITDDTDWGQWYVGNYATGLVPPDTTLYVDDVTIGPTL
jgi:hypothetical protein